MSSGQPPPIPPHGPRHQPVQWNADQTDMSCHRLTPEQLSRKLASRQSHNLALARATLLSAGAQSGQPLTPALAARLRAATEQSLDSVIAECNAAVVTSRRIRQNADDILETDSATTDNTDPSSGMDNPVSTNATSAVSLSQSKENGLLPDCNGIQQSGSVSESSKESRDVRSSSAPPSIATRLTMLPLIASNGSNTSTYSSISSILRNNKPRNSDRLHRNIGSSSGSGNDVPRSSRGSAESNDTPGSGDDSSSNCVRSGPETGIALCASENTSDTASSHDVNSVTAATRASNSSTAGCAVASRSSDEPSSSAFFSAHPSNETSGYSASNSCSQFRYTENLEAARLEHEKELEKLKEECEVDSPPAERFAEVLNLSQCQEQPQHQYLEDRQYQEQQHQHPHGNLDKTLKLVVSTCEALWAQLQQERQTRQQLQEHLQRQGAVIGDLTAELLQIQEQQEDILQEVQLARTSLLWQLNGDDPGDPLPPMGDALFRGDRRAMGDPFLMGDDVLMDAGRAVGDTLLMADRRALLREPPLSSSAPPSLLPSAFTAPYAGLAARPPTLLGAGRPLRLSPAPHSLQNSPKHGPPYPSPSPHPRTSPHPHPDFT